MKLRALLTTGAVTLGLLGSAAPSALAGQTGSGQLRVTVSPARSQVTQLAASPSSNATCTINKISVNRFSECEWVTIHVDVIKVIDGKPEIEGTVDFDVKHQMALNAKSANWSENFTVSKAKTTRAGAGVAVDLAAASGGGTKATVHFSQGHILSSGPANGSVNYTTGPIAKKKINPKAKTHYTYTFTKPGYTPGTVSYDSAVYRCDNFFGTTTGCAIPEVPTGLALLEQPRINEGIRKLRSRGGHYGDPNGGKPLHWMINETQKRKNRGAVCPNTVPPDMKRPGRTSCDEYPFASTYEGGTHLPSNQRSTPTARTPGSRPSPPAATATPKMNCATYAAATCPPRPPAPSPSR